MVLFGLTREAQEGFQDVFCFEWQLCLAFEKHFGSSTSNSMRAAKIVEGHERLTSSVHHFALKMDLIADIWREHSSSNRLSVVSDTTLNLKMFLNIFVLFPLLTCTLVVLYVFSN